MATEPTPYRSLAFAAEYLDVTERTVRRYIADGRLPAKRLGSRGVRIAHKDLDDLLIPIPTATGAGRLA